MNPDTWKAIVAGAVAAAGAGWVVGSLDAAPLWILAGPVVGSAVMVLTAWWLTRRARP